MNEINLTKFIMKKMVVSSLLPWWCGQVAQPCDQMLVGCTYGGEVIDCMKMFSSTLSDGGLCCIFNGLHRKFMMNFRYK